MRIKNNLTKEQMKHLDELSRYFEKVEKLAAKNNVDLDVFVTEYKDNGYSVYATEQVQMDDESLRKNMNKEEQQSTSRKRKKVFEGQGKEKTVKTQTKH
jgi:hypothetical protein